jgi:hypothetical protein
MTIATITTILGLISKILDLGWKIAGFVKDFLKERILKKKYEDSKKAVEDGDVDKINDIIRDKN